MSDLLQLEEVSGGYYGQTMVHTVSLEVKEGEAVTAIGANGAGKTTLLRIIMGQIPATSGHIRFQGRDFAKLPMYERAKMGIGYVPEGRALFLDMTVEENLSIGTYHLKRDVQKQRLQHILSVFPKLERLQKTRSRLLSGGEQQMVTVGRALMRNPQLLILDEPSTGLAPKVVGELYAALRVFNREKLAVFVVEQNAYAALHFAERGYVFENGHITRSAQANDLLQDPHLVEAYVGRTAPTADKQQS